MARGAEDRPHQVALCLGLVVAWDIRADNWSELGEGLGDVVDEQLPLGAPWQRSVEIVVGKTTTFAVCFAL
jgi:hypothetical protein